jgi:O-antigen ligase
VVTRALSFVSFAGCVLLLWSGLTAHPACAALLLLVAAAAALRPAAGLMIALALSPVATTSIGILLGLRGEWGEAVVLAAGAGWLLRAGIDGGARQRVVGRWPLAVLACVAVASLAVQFRVLAVKISPELLGTDVVSAIGTYIAGRSQSAAIVRPVALVLEGLLLFAMGSTLNASAIPRVLRAFVAGACGAAALNIFRLANAAARSDTPLSAFLDLARTVRVSLPYPDVNAAGSYFVLALFAAAGLASSARSRARAPWYVALIVLAAGVWISGSRTALLAALLVAAAITIAGAAGRRAVLRLSVVAIVAGVLIAVFPHPVLGRSAIGAITIRAELARTAGRLFATAPVFGIGIGEFFERSADYILDPGVRRIYPRENAHNNFLQVLAETGIVGFGAFLWLLVASGAAMRRGVRQDANRWPRMGAIGGTGAFLVTCLAGHPLLTAEVAFAFWGILGIAAAGAPEPAGAARSPARLVAAAAVLAIAAGLPLRMRHAADVVDMDHVGYRVTLWNTDSGGVRYRQMESGATLFVPAEAAVVELPYRLQWGATAVTLQLEFLGRTADRLVVDNHDWRTYRLVVPEAHGTRRFLPLTLTVLQGDDAAVLLGKMTVRNRQGVR